MGELTTLPMPVMLVVGLGPPKWPILCRMGR